MATYAVRYTQPLLGAQIPNGPLHAVLGASVLIRQNGVATTVYSSRTKAALANPVPTGVAQGAAGIDTAGNLTVWLEPGEGYDFVATVGATSTTVAMPTMSPDDADTLNTTTAQTLPVAAEKFGAFFHINAPIDVKPTNVAATDTANIQAAFDRAAGTGGGRPTRVRLICGPDQSGAVSIDSTLTNIKGGVWLEADARGSTGSGVRLKWVGAAGGKMMQITNVDAGVRNIVFDANNLAATCLEYLHSERQGYENLGCYNYTGEGLIIGNGTPNNNGFRGKGTLYLVGKDGSTGLALKAASTEDINLDTVHIIMGSGAVTGVARMIDISNVAHLHIGHLVLDDDFSTGYAIRVGGGGSIGIDDLASEAKQTIEFTPVGRGRSSYILRGDLRSSTPAVGEYAIKYDAAAGQTKGLMLGVVNINRKAGATVAPDVYVNNGFVFAAGVDFTTTDVGATLGKFAPTSTGRVFDASGASLAAGTGSPEGVVRGGPGSMFQRTDGGAGTSLYIKESAVGLLTGWRALAPAGQTYQKDVYSTVGSFTWTKPTWATSHVVRTGASGGGGGSGRKGALGTGRAGGGAGGAGGFSEDSIRSADLPATVNVTVGDGGAGGAAVTTDSTDGNAGASGGLTFFGPTSTTAYVRAAAGQGGGGGTATAGTAGPAGSGTFAGAAGAAATTGAGALGGSGVKAGAGGSGGGITTGDVASAGGNSGVPLSRVGSTATAGGAIGANGANGTTPAATSPLGGSGGGGGGSSTTGNGGNGGEGSFGAGGGGGGAAVNTVGNSGAGGKGGPGYVIIESFA